MDFSIASVEATLLFDNVTVNALCTNGYALQAWRLLCNNSTIKAEVNNGYGLVCNFNAFVSENEKLNKLFKQGWYIVDHKITCSPHDEVYMSILLERVKK